MTTRNDEGADTGIVDMGYHYPITGDALINVEAVGSRFMKFSLSNLMPGTAKPRAILVTSPLDSCPDYYVQADGSLGLDPAFLSAAEWNNGVVGKYLSGPYITPETEFAFQAAVGDCAPHGVLNVQDVQITQLVIQMDFHPSNYGDLLANFPDCRQDPCPVD